MNKLVFITLFVTVHNSGIISGQFMNSGAVKCGANICKPVTGVFTRNPLPPGYIDITMIPAGASNISVTEMKNSGNLLVLKTVEGRFVINANFKTSPSGLYEAAGAVFDYRRLDGLRNFSGGVQEGVTEWITCMGPTTEAIYLMILAERPNPGVKYDYLLPIKANVMTNSEENFGNESGETSLLNGLKAADQSISEHSSNHRRRRFMWKVIGLSPCTKTCGGGIQTPIIKCIRENPTRVFNPKRCAHLRQPETSETQTKCNVQPCPPYWKLSEWTSCRCDEHKVQEWRSREVKCVQELVSGIVIHVNHAACIEDEPSEREKCLCLNNRKPSEQTISSIRNKNRKKIEEERKYGTWLVSNWSDECSMACGVGLQYRSIFCDRSTSPNFERCDLRLNPETTRECSSNEKCSFGEWFTGPWSKCSGDCFNLTKSRSIVCIKNDGFASDDECNLEEKPSVSEKCPMTEVTYCRPKWHYSEWTKCSKSCGSGTQRRNVKCIEPNTDQMKESKNCRFSEREVAHRKCNEEKCQATISTTDPSFDPRVDLIQNDSSCVDDFPNCHLVIKAKLCSYTYYTNHCCQSCKIQLNELN